MADGVGGAGAGAGGPRADGLNADLKAMRTVAEDNRRALVMVAESLERMSRGAKDGNKGLLEQSTSIRRLLRDTTDLEFASIRIQKLQKARIAPSSSQAGAKAYIKQLQQEYQLLLKILNTTKGGGKYTKDIQNSLVGLNAALKKIETQNRKTWRAEDIHEVNAALRETSRLVGTVHNDIARIKTRGLTDQLKSMGTALDGAFGGQFMNKLSRIPGIQHAITGFRVRGQAKAAQAKLGEAISGHNEHNERAQRENLLEIKRKHGIAGLAKARQLGATEVLPRSARAGSVAPEGRGSKAKAWKGKYMGSASAAADYKELMGGAGGRTPGSGGATRGRKAPIRKGQIDAVKLMLHGGGPEATLDEVRTGMGAGATSRLGRSLNATAERGAAGEGGWFAKHMADRAHAGNGSVTAGTGAAIAGAAGGGLMAVLGAVAVAAPVVGLITGVGAAMLALRDKTAKENNTIKEGLAGTGIFGGVGPNGPHFQGIRNTLLSTGFSNASKMGQGMEQNMGLLKSLGEAGWATGGTTNQEYDEKKHTGVHLGKAMDDYKTPEGNGFYGAVMKNAVYHGANMGFSQDTSTKLTLKLMEKFGQTTLATQDFFVHLNTLMSSTGISATKYLEVIDTITDQFGDMNKNLIATVATLTTLGKVGHLTGDQLKDVVKGIQSPTGTSTAQKIVLAGDMVHSGASKTAAEGMESSAGAVLARMNEQLKAIGLKDVNGRPIEITANKDGTLSGVAEATLAIHNSSMNEEEKKAALGSVTHGATTYGGNMMGANAMRSGNPEQIAGLMDTVGENSLGAGGIRAAGMYRMMGILKMSKKDQAAVMSGDQNAFTKMMSSGRGNLVMSQMKQEGTLLPGFNPEEYVNARGRASDTGAMGMMDIGRKAAPDAGEAALMARYMKKIAPEFKKGATDEDYTQEFQRRSRSTDASEQSQMFKALKDLPETIDEVMTAGTVLQMRNQEKVQAEADAKKAASIAFETRTSAQIFASAFAYLFARVTTCIDKNLGGTDKASKEDIATAEVAAMNTAMTTVDPTKLNKGEKRRYEGLKKRLADSPRGMVNSAGDPDEPAMASARDFLQQHAQKWAVDNLAARTALTTDAPKADVDALRQASEATTTGRQNDVSGTEDRARKDASAAAAAAGGMWKDLSTDGGLRIAALKAFDHVPESERAADRARFLGQKKPGIANDWFGGDIPAPPSGAGPYTLVNNHWEIYHSSPEQAPPAPKAVAVKKPAAAPRSVVAAGKPGGG